MTPRRPVLAMLPSAGLLGVPLGADAQQSGKVRRIGVLGATSASACTIYIDAFRLGRRDLGYVEGRNVVIESRWADGRHERLPGLAAEPKILGVTFPQEVILRAGKLIR